jgi:lipopolysaccharide/colanic/teichoic acid biosynthesis glycosyltransferase
MTALTWVSEAALVDRRREWIKRAFDLGVCLLVLPAVLLVVALCIVAIRLDTPGAAVFGQWRTGRDGRRFRMWKLRTMVANAEELKPQLAHLNVLAPPDFKIPDDPRITRVGRFLRRTSLDELPQVLNVLTGDMSLVGPRPTSFGPTTYSLWHTARLEVRPGLTGLWQIRARSGSSFDERLRLDIEYVEHRSLLLDLSILWGTVGAVLHRTGE